MEPQQPFVCPSHTNHYIAVFVLGAIIGGGALFTYGYQKGFTGAKNRVLNHPTGDVFRPVEDVRILSGVVIAVDGSSLTIKAHQFSPFEDPDLANRTVTIASDTKITRRAPGDMQAFQAAMEAFMKKMQSNPKTAGTPPTPPEPVITPIELSAIVAGDTVTVTTLENVATMKSFPASEIEVQ